MSTVIHPTAIVDPGAQIGVDVTVGPFTIIESDVQIGDRCIIGPHVMIGEGTRLGEECRVFKSAAVGLLPQDKKFESEKTYTNIGSNTLIREFVTINRGTSASGETRIGSNCWIMAYCHIAHDCILGDDVTISNALAMAGHVEVGSHVTIGGIVPIHQFTRIGDYAFIGAVSRPFMDVVPFAMCSGETETRIVGINKVGLERHGFSPERRDNIKRAFRVLFRENLTLSDSITKLEQTFPGNEDIARIVTFAKGSKRGLMRMKLD